MEKNEVGKGMKVWLKKNSMKRRNLVHTYITSDGEEVKIERVNEDEALVWDGRGEYWVMIGNLEPVAEKAGKKWRMEERVKVEQDLLELVKYEAKVLERSETAIKWEMLTGMAESLGVRVTRRWQEG